MAEVLLEELLDSDIRWMSEVGQKQLLSANELLLRQGDPIENLYFVLEGKLVATVADALSEDQELIRFSVGDVLGETSIFKATSSLFTIKAVEAGTVLVLSKPLLLARLSQDLDFSARFYRTVSILVLQRFERLLDRFSRRRGLQVSLLEEGPVLFGELSDGDVDWMVNQGNLEEVEADQILIQAGRSVEQLYIVLQGRLSLSMVENKREDLNDIFSQVRGISASAGRQIALISKGEIVGETALLDSRRLNFTVKTQEASLLLALPRQSLALKIQQDPAMAARFYRVLIILISGRFEGLISRLGYGREAYPIGGQLSDEVQYDDELDLELIDSLNIGGERFNWMLNRLKVKGTL